MLLRKAIYHSGCLFFHFSGSIAADCCWLIQNRLKKKIKKLFGDFTDTNFPLRMQAGGWTHMGCLHILQICLSICSLYGAYRWIYAFTDLPT